MPQQPSKRKHRPGQGRPAALENARRVNFYVEDADLNALKLLPGDASAHVRTAIKAYLARKSVATQVREALALPDRGES